MFDYLANARRASSLPMGPGAVASALLHLGLVAFAAYDRAQNLAISETITEETVGLEYIAPPDVNSAASRIQIRYEASGGAEGIADPTDRRDGTGARVRGAGPGESAVASVSGGDEPDQFAMPTDDPYEDAFSNTEVEQQAERDPESAAPAYPKELMARGVEGYAALRFVIDSTGAVDLSTVRVIEFTHPEFVAAVRQAMPNMKFAPARLGDRPVRQLAEQLFRFAMETTPAISAPATASSAPAPRRPPPPR